jgi:ankyrin repeat protein
MNKSDNKTLFKAIEDGDWPTIEALLDKNPGDVDVYGIANRLCRDKTPLMYALQCENFEIARRFIARGADVSAKMADGPKLSVLALAVKFGHGLNPQHERWIEFAAELIEKGATPTDALWSALTAYDLRNDKSGMIRLLIEAGADLDSEIPVGKIRDLVKVNEQRYSDEVLALCGVRR